MTRLLRTIPLLLSALCICIPAFAQVTAIRAGYLVDPEGGRTLQNQIILVENGIISAVGGDVSIPAGAEVIDLSDATVSPGLFDAHTHLCMTVQLGRDNANYFYTTLRDPDAARAIDGVVNARDMLHAGFTTVRDIGNEGNYACTYVRRAIERGAIPGPTMLNAGRIIAPYGGQFSLQPDKPDLAEPEYLFADTRDEMVKAIRKNAHFGATVIKIVTDDQVYDYNEEDIRFMIGEAKRAGLKLAAHAWSPEGTHAAAAAGVASIEHGNQISNEDLELAKQNGVVMVFTPFPQWVLEKFRQQPGRAAREYQEEVSAIRRAYERNVPIAFGTDAIHDLPDYDRGTQAMTWIDSYVDAGMPPAAILKSMTVIAAELLGVHDERGSIEPGLAADLIATPANPLDDIHTLKRVRFVMKDGKVFRHDGTYSGNLLHD